MKPTETLSLRKCFPNDEEAIPLLTALSNELFQITGNDGKASFSDDDMSETRSIFLVASIGEESVGCGGLRPITDKVCEIKRMYAKYRGKGIGKEILRQLEKCAKEFEYKEIWLETRKVNENAVDFYLSQGYQIRDNYGKYIGRTEAICFEKALTTN